MIDSKNLFDVSVALTSRKLQLCQLVKNQLLMEGISKTNENIINAVSKINNAFFITEIESKKNKILVENNVLHKLIKQHPRLLDIVYRELFQTGI